MVERRGDKKKTFDFQKQMKDTLPEQYQTEVKPHVMTGPDISQKLELLDTMMKTMKPNIGEPRIHESTIDKVNGIGVDIANGIGADIANGIGVDIAKEIIDNTVEKINP